MRSSVAGRKRTSPLLRRILAKVTADAIADLLANGALPQGFERFDPCRFARAAVPA